VLRVGVVGAGTWGKNIVRTLHQTGALAAFAEPDEVSRSEAAAACPGVPSYPGLPEMLDGTDLDAVAVATPAESHHALATTALRAGLHVFIEKPMALTVPDAEDLVGLADGLGKTLMVGHLLLYQPAIEFIKREIESGRIGRVFSFNHERLNLGRARKVEDVLWSLGVHDVAVCLHLAGKSPEHVSLVGQDALQPGVNDDTRLTLRFEGGILGHIHNSWLWPELRRRLTVVGSQGMLVYDETSQTVTWHNKGINADLSNRDSGSETLFEGAGQPLALEMEHFIECCLSGQAPRSDGRSGLEVVRVLAMASGHAP
jgi:predicted dehydrogenase